MIIKITILIIIHLYMHYAINMDKNTLEKGFIYEHFTRVMQRLLMITPLAFIVDGQVVYDSWYVLINWLVFASWFAAWFSPLLALRRGDSFWSLGKTAHWDKFWRKRPIAYRAFIILLNLSYILYLSYE